MQTSVPQKQTRQQKEQERLNLKYGDQTLIEKQIELDAAMMFKKRKEDSILGFTGYWDFLKPEFPAKVSYDGELYNSVSHVYTAL